MKPAVKQESGEGDVFSKLMTSYKENEAWKEASTVEDRNFRPTRANRRKAPFYKVLQGMPISVDAFRYGAIPNCTAYFLTYVSDQFFFVASRPNCIADTRTRTTTRTYRQIGNTDQYTVRTAPRT